MSSLPPPNLLRDQEDFRVDFITILIEGTNFVMDPLNTSSPDCRTGHFVKINSYLFGISNFLPRTARKEVEYQVITRKPASKYYFSYAGSDE